MREAHEQPVTIGAWAIRHLAFLNRLPNVAWRGEHNEAFSNFKTVQSWWAGKQKEANSSFVETSPSGMAEQFSKHCSACHLAEGGG